MFEYIKGKVVSIKEGYIVLENNNIGYKIFTSLATISQITKDEDILIYIYFNVREDGVYLYGFNKEEELDMFNLLILVSGVGPKTALGILSTMMPSELKLAIMNRDIKTLTKAQGIGKKTAERIILELKDKVENIDIDMTDEDILLTNDNMDIVVDGLESLGYTRGEIKRVLSNLDIEEKSEEDIIKLFLKNISNK